ncbi:alpha/beta hydrolase family protein [Pseudonocardia sp. GCM10023141]|uniref:alpha/beta hydrolase family protein n=1 Tax=Pseudonocardia sp. GCM10023141 TaxID=3252653 RepID=UPI003606CEF4
MGSLLDKGPTLCRSIAPDPESIGVTPCRIIGAVAVLQRVGTALGVGIGAGAAGIGWFYSTVLLDPTPRPEYPELVVASDATSIVLAATRLTSQPGTWGLRWPEGLAAVGPVTGTRPGAVVRSRLGGPIPAPGTAVQLDTVPFDPDPGAVGLAFADVEIATEVGPCPAWEVPAAGASRADTWVVLVHGRGGSRREALRVLPTLHARGFSALAITYRNDVEAPRSPDGHYHLGDTEWTDLEAGVRHAVAHGARRIVLFGWSMGGAIIGAFLDRSPLAAQVAAVVWDAPLVDWRATLRQQARNRRLPPGLTPLATTFASRRIGIDFDRFDLLRHPPTVRPPTLLIHSTEDTAVPVGPSRALAAAAPTLDWPMQYIEVLGVEHTGSWNAAPAAYEQALDQFLLAVLR